MATTDLDHSRAGERVPYAARLLVVHANQAWFAAAHDLSEGGCGVFRPDDCDLEAEQVLRLFFLTDDNAPAVPVLARVAWATTRQIGFEYHEPQAIPPCRTPR